MILQVGVPPANNIFFQTNFRAGVAPFRGSPRSFAAAPVLHFRSAPRQGRALQAAHAFKNYEL